MNVICTFKGLLYYKLKKLHEPCLTPAGSIGPDLLNELNEDKTRY